MLTATIFHKVWSDLDPAFRWAMIIGFSLGGLMILAIIGRAIYDHPQVKRQRATYGLFAETRDRRFYVLDVHELTEGVEQDHERRRDRQIEHEERTTGGTNVRGRGGPIEAGVSTSSETRTTERSEHRVSDRERHNDALGNWRTRPVYGLDQAAWWSPRSKTVPLDHHAMLENAIRLHSKVALQGRFEPLDSEQGKRRWSHRGTIGPRFIIEAADDAVVPRRNLDDIPKSETACYGWIRHRDGEDVIVSAISLFK